MNIKDLLHSSELRIEIIQIYLRSLGLGVPKKSTARCPVFKHHLAIICQEKKQGKEAEQGSTI